MLHHPTKNIWILLVVNMEIEELAAQLLETIIYEDIEYDFKNGGMYRGKCKAREIQTNNSEEHSRNDF